MDAMAFADSESVKIRITKLPVSSSRQSLKKRLLKQTCKQSFLYRFHQSTQSASGAAKCNHRLFTAETL